MDLRATACILFASCTIAPPTAPWARSFDAPGREIATSLAETTDGGVLLAGDTIGSFGTTGTHLWLVRVTADGGVLWQEALVGAKSETHALVVTREGGFILACTTYSDGEGGADIWVASINDDGSIAWQEALGGPGDELVAGITLRSDGGIFIFGTTTSFGAGNHDWLLMRLQADGQLASATTYGDSDDQEAAALARFEDDSLIVAGQSTRMGDSDAAYGFVDDDGTLTHATALGGLGSELTTAVSTDGDDFTLLASTTSFGAGGSDAWVIDGHRSGSLVSQRALGGVGDDSLVGLRSNWAIGTTTIGTDTQLWLVGLAGSAVTTESAYGGGGADMGAAIGQTPSGNLWLQGTTSSFGNTGPDFWLVQLDSQRDLFQLGATLTTHHATTTAKPRALTFTTASAPITETLTQVAPVRTHGTVVPEAGN